MILEIIRDLIKLFIINLPGRSGVKLRQIYYKKKLKNCGKNLHIETNVYLDGVEHISIGDNVCIDRFSIISTGVNIQGEVHHKINDNNINNGEIIIGSNIHICQGVIIMGYGGISIGNNSVMSAGCKIYSLSNTAYKIGDRKKIISIMPYSTAPFIMGSVILDENVWLGLNTIIMPGVTIKRNSFSSSNSLIMSSFPENSHLKGQPAEIVGSRFNE
jgi:acetyltransferase-like isoleucine patch superfamily enzyme